MIFRLAAVLALAAAGGGGEIGWLTVCFGGVILWSYPLRESCFSAWFELVGAPLKLNIDSAFSENRSKPIHEDGSSY